MYFLFFLSLSVLLAIPTYGLSLLFFFLAKNWFDNRAMSTLLGAAVTAMRTEVSEERYHINQAAIRKVFNRFAVGPAQVEIMGNGAITFYWGLLRHPTINDNKVFSVRFAYTPRNGSSNTVFIKAAEGNDPRVLSADDISDLASNLMAIVPDTGHGKNVQVEYVCPHSDEEIWKLLCDLADRSDTICNYPNLSYGRMCNFASGLKFDPEFFEDEDAMRFEFADAKCKYGVRVDNLSARGNGPGGVSIVSAIIGFVEEVEDVSIPTVGAVGGDSIAFRPAPMPAPGPTLEPVPAPATKRIPKATSTSRFLCGVQDIRASLLEEEDLFERVVLVRSLLLFAAGAFLGKNISEDEFGDVLPLYQEAAPAFRDDEVQLGVLFDRLDAFLMDYGFDLSDNEQLAIIELACAALNEDDGSRDALSDAAIVEMVERKVCAEETEASGSVLHAIAAAD